MKLKYLIAALTLLGSAASQAALVKPDDLGNGESALVVYDSNASYTLDLGVTYSQFLAGANSSATLATLNSANWGSFASAEAGSSADWQYAVIGAKTNHAGNNSAVLSTISADYVGSVAASFASADVEGAVAQFPAYYDAVNVTGTHKSATNGDSYNLSGTPAYFLTNGMDTFNGVLYENSGAVGTSMAVDQVMRNQASLSAPTENTLAGLMNLSLVNSNYVLSYNVAAVPDAPGVATSAAGLALVGFMALRRRNNRG